MGWRLAGVLYLTGRLHHAIRMQQLTICRRGRPTFKVSCACSMLRIIEEASSFLQHQLQLHQLTVATLQALTVAIDL